MQNPAADAEAEVALAPEIEMEAQPGSAGKESFSRKYYVLFYRTT